MLACGNEPSGRWVEWVTKFVEYWEKKDPRHVYTGASVGDVYKRQDVHISIVENPRPSYFCATINTLKQHDEEKINTDVYKRQECTFSSLVLR